MSGLALIEDVSKICPLSWRSWSSRAVRSPKEGRGRRGALLTRRVRRFIWERHRPFPVTRSRL